MPIIFYHKIFYHKLLLVSGHCQLLLYAQLYAQQLTSYLT